MEAGAAGAGIGGEIANKKWVESGEFEKITEAARLTIEKLHGGTPVSYTHLDVYKRQG